MAPSVRGIGIFRVLLAGYYQPISTAKNSISIIR